MSNILTFARLACFTKWCPYSASSIYQLSETITIQGVILRLLDVRATQSVRGFSSRATASQYHSVTDIKAWARDAETHKRTMVCCTGLVSVAVLSAFNLQVITFRVYGMHD